MGRNGKQTPIFLKMVNFVNDNVGNIVTSQKILFGKEPFVGSTYPSFTNL